ncbi:Hypothetical protein RADP37_05450 (plasmid) [Roseomonas mucosa]|uniref:DUF7666 domain-containing protein n=1 Tax=Roseomonas mucosa TaxID=207340 RepID=A0A4Y1MS38_9PROT|nr:hypothetical protein [Roseomonas mucosa]AWV20334.1 Hypothetical protein RADP37_05450 [Roseomonas mucosa]
MTAKTPRKRAVKPPPEQPESPAPILAFKGFDQAMQCRGFQYAVGQTYTMDGPIEACRRGFHACENPFDVWSYYNVTDSRFAIVEMGGETSGETSREQGGDSKIAAASITIKAELTLPEFTGRAVDWIVALTKGGKEADDGNGARIGSSGYGARIGSSGNGAQIGSSGNDAQIGSSGYGARIGSSGYGARIGSSGNDAQIGSSGNGARIGSSGNDAQIGSSGNGAQIGSSGNGARIGSSGNGAQIGSSGNGARIDASGENGVVAAAGRENSFRLGAGGCASAPYHDGTRVRFAVAYAGENVEPGVWYSVNERGEFVREDRS